MERPCDWRAGGAPQLLAERLRFEAVKIRIYGRGRRWSTALPE